MHNALTISVQPMFGLKLLDRLLSAIAIKTPSGSSRVLLSMGSGFFLEALRLVYELYTQFFAELPQSADSKMTIRSSELLPPAPIYYA